MSTTTTPIPDPTTDKPRRYRRWIPLTLKMFVVVLVLLGVGSLLWIGCPHIRNAGYSLDRKLGRTRRTQTDGPEWLRPLVSQGHMKGSPGL